MVGVNAFIDTPTKNDIYSHSVYYPLVMVLRVAATPQKVAVVLCVQELEKSLLTNIPEVPQRRVVCKISVNADFFFEFQGSRYRDFLSPILILAIT